MVLAWIQERFAWPIPVAGIFLALALLYAGVAHQGLRKHYILIALVWLLLPTVRSFHLSLQARQALFDFMIGASLILGGIADHRVLRQALQPPPSEPYVGTV